MFARILVLKFGFCEIKNADFVLEQKKGINFLMPFFLNKVAINYIPPICFWNSSIVTFVNPSPTEKQSLGKSFENEVAVIVISPC